MIYDTFISFIKSHPKFFLTNCVLMLLVPINEVFLSRLYGRLFDAIQKNTFTMNHFYVILGTMVFLQIGFSFNDYFNSKQMTEFQQFCKVRFLKTVFDKLKNNNIEPEPGEVLAKILRTQHILADWYSKVFSYLIPIGLQLLITTIYFFKIDVYLGTFLIVLLSIFITFLSNTNNLCNGNNVVLDEKYTKLNQNIGDVLVNYLSVHKEQTLTSEINILKKDFKDYQKYHNETILCSIKYRLLLSSVIITFLALFVTRCYKLLKTKKIPNAVFYSVFMILANLISNMVYMVDMHRDMIFDWGLIKNSGFDVENMTPLLPYKCNTKLDKKAIIELKDVDFRYKTKYIIKDLSLAVYPKERLAITGHIGSGKSTLMKILLRLVNPEKGGLYLHQQCISEIGIKKYFSKVGFMPQNSLLFKRSIVENIMYDNKAISEQEILYTLKKYDITKHFKNGLDISTDSLSGGQRQLVWFLRIYFKNPDVILLDEPTASLDKETKDLFIHLMNTMMKDKTIIIITHDQYLLDFVTRVVDINQINHVSKKDKEFNQKQKSQKQKKE